MRIIGKGKIFESNGRPSAENLLRGCQLNEEAQKLPTGNTTFIKKGLYRFRSHEEMNKFDEDCRIEGIVKLQTTKQT